MEDLLEQMAADAAMIEAEPSQPQRDTTSHLVALGEEMLRVKDEIDSLNEQKKLAQERYDELRKTLIPEALEAAGLRGSFTLASGDRLTLSTKTYANVKAADREKFHSWLREIGAQDLIKEAVNANTLSAFARERLENGEDLPPEVSIYTETTVSVTRAKR